MRKHHIKFFTNFITGFNLIAVYFILVYLKQQSANLAPNDLTRFV